MQGQIYKQALTALLDTGSQYTYISPCVIPPMVEPTSVLGHRVNTINSVEATRVDKEVVLNHCQIPELSPSRTIKGNIHCYISPRDTQYDLIIGRDLLHALGIVLDNDKQTIFMIDTEYPYQLESEVGVAQDDFDPIVDAFLADIKESKYEERGRSEAGRYSAAFGPSAATGLT